jgi:RNA polymerase sigma-70 factor, ECF subfamily
MAQRTATGGHDTVEEHDFKRLYAVAAKRLYNFILWTTGNRAACDDILQNVFFKVWRCEKAPADENGCMAWLYAIARNACIDYFRSVRKFTEYNDAIATGEEAGDCPDRVDDGKLAWHEAAQLPETERSIVYLHCKMGYSYGEIGRMMELTENNVRVKAFRALKKLRDILIKKGL